MAERARCWGTAGGAVLIYAAAVALGISRRPDIGREGVIFNHGVAFGLFAASPPWLLAGASALGLAALALAMWKFAAFRIPLAVIFAGALANWTERLWWGGIVDFWHIPGYPYTFNLADIAIRTGMLAVFIQYVLARSGTRRST